MNAKRWLHDQAGFTLIELLGVALIVVLLALMALPIYAEAHDKGRNAKSKADIREISQALEAYKIDKAVYPAKLKDLKDGGYLRNNVNFATAWDGYRDIFYVYYINDSANPTRYVLGDPGVDCSTNSDALRFCSDRDGTGNVTPIDIPKNDPTHQIKTVRIKGQDLPDGWISSH